MSLRGGRGVALFRYLLVSTWHNAGKRFWEFEAFKTHFSKFVLSFYRTWCSLLKEITTLVIHIVCVSYIGEHVQCVSCIGEHIQCVSFIHVISSSINRCIYGFSTRRISSSSSYLILLWLRFFQLSIRGYSVHLFPNCTSKTRDGITCCARLETV